MIIPLTQWKCDVCEKIISCCKEAYVVWMDDDTNGPYNFKIIHKGTCDHHDHNCSLHLEAFLGEGGKEYLLSFLSAGAIKRKIGHDPVRPPADLDEFVDLFRRVQTPYYEEARRRFGESKVLVDYHDDNAFGPYLEEGLTRIIGYESGKIDGYALVSSLYETEDMPLAEAIEKIKQAESHAPDNDGLCWVQIARAWFELSKIHNLGFEDVRRCLLIAEPLHNFIDGLMEGLRLWFELAKVDPKEYDMARRWMGVIEKDVNTDPNPSDVCECACAWAKFPTPEDRRNALRLLDYANEIYELVKVAPFEYSAIVDKDKLLAEYRKAMVAAEKYCAENLLDFP